MPIHDWTRVDAGLSHAFHVQWISALCDALNLGALPSDYFALPEQSIAGPVPDVLTLRLSQGREESPPSTPGLAVAEVPPRARVVRRSESEEILYARKADRVTVRHRHGQVVAVVEIVSPGNKASKSEPRAFREKTAALIRQGIHLLIVDLFPPTKRDPHGLHKVLWDEFEEEDFAMPVDKPLLVASYNAGPPLMAYVEPVAVGDDLPDLPLFLKPEYYVPAPLAASYQTTWDVFPAAMKRLLESPAAPPAAES